MINTSLNEKNIMLFAAQHYTNYRVLDIQEFYDDFLRFKYLKKLFTRYKDKNVLQERLILNHLIHLYNVFENNACTQICAYKISKESWGSLKTFLIFLNRVSEDNPIFINTPVDLYVTRKLQVI